MNSWNVWELSDKLNVIKWIHGMNLRIKWYTVIKWIHGISLRIKWYTQCNKMNSWNEFIGKSRKSDSERYKNLSL